MTKKPTHGLRGVTPQHLKAAWLIAKRERNVSQGDIARALQCDQQVVSRIFLGETKEGGWKFPIIKFLAQELFQVAEQDKKLMKELHALGLRQKDDADMTTAGDKQGGTGAPGYTFDLYEPRLARGELTMAFPAKPSAKTLPPNFPHSLQSYAFRMVGDMMRPAYWNGDEVYVDPAAAPQIGDDCLFHDAGRSQTRIGHLTGFSAEAWRITTRPETRFEEAHELAMSDWPICEKIVGKRNA